MNYIRQTPTEECPLTKEKQGFSLSDCCGFRSIILSFSTLTVVITVALVLQLIYDDNAFQGSLNLQGAVATDYTNCSQIGTKILRKGGNSVDAAVAATICMAVVAPHKAGLGSNGYIMIYHHKEQEDPIIIDFLTNTTPDEFDKFKIRIPSLLQGLAYAHYLYGKISWNDLIQPSILLARKGFEISRDLAFEASKNNDLGTFGKISTGEILAMPEIADTLEAVSQHGTNAFYNGSLTNKILLNITENVKLLNELANYEPKLIGAQKSTLAQFAVFYPSAMNFVEQVIEEIDKLNVSYNDASFVNSEIIFAEKIIQLIRQVKPMYINYTESRRYTGISSVDWQDTYVSVVIGLSAPFNATLKTEAGFAFDSSSNKDALLTFSPIIFYDESALCGLRGVFSTDDAVTTGQLLNNLIIRSMNISSAVENARFYILPDGLSVESSRLLHDGLAAIDAVSKVDANTLMKSVNVIVKRKNVISAHSDSRADGLASRFKDTRTA